VRDLELTATSDGDLDLGLAALRALGLNLPDDVHAVDHRAKHDVLAVQMRRLGRADEELGAVGVGAGVGHGQDPWPGVLEVEVLVVELVAVDGLAAGAVVVREVTTLAHELRDDTVEDGAGEPEPLLPGAEYAEVLGGPWNDVVAELHHNPARGLTPGLHIKVHTWQTHCTCYLHRLYRLGIRPFS